jgi:propanol-preferring alcohol dehydrogenase
VLREFAALLVLEQRPDPDPREEEVVVEVRSAGVCHTDLHLLDGQTDLEPPLILGHEIAGVAAGLGPVLVYAAWGCGGCRFCAQGEEQLCSELVLPGFERDGGYAERVLVPSERYLLPLEGLDPVGAAPLADAGLTSYRAARRVAADLGGGATALVVGAGGLGQFALQYLKLLTDARVVAVDPSHEKRELALELGADEAAAPDEVDVPARAVLDFVGSDSTLALAARLVEPGGIVVQIGAARGQLAFGLGDVPWEARFTTSIMGSLADQDAVLGYARRGEVRWHVEPLPLEAANDALDRLRRGNVRGRLVLVP